MLFLTSDLSPHRLRFRSCLQSRVLNVRANSETVTIILANCRFRSVGEAIEKMPLSIALQVSNIQKAIQIHTFADLLRIAEITDVPAILVKHNHQVRLPKRWRQHLAPTPRRPPPTARPRK